MKPTDKKVQCAVTIWRPGTFGSSRCRAAVFGQEDGKSWCKIHLPSAVKAKKATKDAKFSKEMDTRMAYFRRHEAETAALVGIADPVAFVQAVRNLASVIGDAASHGGFNPFAVGEALVEVQKYLHNPTVARCSSCSAEMAQSSDTGLCSVCGDDADSRARLR